MIKLNIFNPGVDKKLEFVGNIINASSPKADFYFLISLATAIVSLGIVANNLALIIAGMIIAPLLSSVLAISLGISVRSGRLMWRSLKIFILSTIIAVGTAWFFGLLFPLRNLNSEILTNMHISYLSFTIALIAGLTAAYTWRQTEIRDALPGIAIAVTLVPPLAALGLVIASENWTATIEITKFFGLNVAGIFLAGLIIFFVPNFHHLLRAKKIADQEIKNEINHSK